MEKNLYIVRGVPGSGKSTLARSIAKPWQIFEADQFFMKNDDLVRSSHPQKPPKPIFAVSW